MTGPNDTTRPISVAELLAKNGTTEPRPRPVAAAVAETPTR